MTHTWFTRHGYLCMLEKPDDRGGPKDLPWFWQIRREGDKWSLRSEFAESKDIAWWQMESTLMALLAVDALKAHEQLKEQSA